MGDDIDGNYFFGKLTEVSLHSTVRDADYILKESLFRAATEFLPQGILESPSDNGDRLLIFQYQIPDNFDYQKVVVVKKEFSAPSWEGDGEVIFEADRRNRGVLLYRFRFFCVRR